MAEAPADPIAELFEGQAARDLFAGRAPRACHGALERLPACFRSGLLSSAGHLARTFPGTVQIANGTATAGSQVALGRAPAARLLDLGLTVGFDAVQAHDTALAAWCQRLEAALGVPGGSVRLMAFANAPGTGLPLHHDVHDQLLLHLEGEKTLHWAPNRHTVSPAGRFAHHDLPQRGFGGDYAQGFPATPEAVRDDGLEAVPLRPGTVLYVPGGTWHTTAEQTETTLSVAVIVHAPSRNELLLRALAWYLDGSETGRARVYGAWSDAPEAALEGVAEQARALAARLGTLDLREAAAVWDLDRSLADPRAFPGATAFARWIRLPFARITTTPDGADGLRVRVRCGWGHHAHADTVLLTRADAAPVLAWIAACDRAFTVDELDGRSPTLPREELEVLLGALGQAQAVRPLPLAPWDPPVSD